jgi:hypothetical protein
MDGRTTLFIGVPPILYWSKLLKGRKTMNLLNSRGGIATITKSGASPGEWAAPFRRQLSRRERSGTVRLQSVL